MGGIFPTEMVEWQDHWNALKLMAISLLVTNGNHLLRDATHSCRSIEAHIYCEALSQRNYCLILSN